jgi:phosphomannomutase
MAQILDAMTARVLPISQLADELPRYEIYKTKTTVAQDQTAAALAAVREHFSDAEASELDGLRLDWPGRWLLVRASNTEPIVRIICEDSDIEKAQAICAETAQVIARSS